MVKTKLVKGQSLFEVMVTLMIVSLVITAVAGMALLSIKASNFSKNKTQATRYIQEANEWLRSQKDGGWGVFLTKVSSLSVDLADGQRRICLQTINNWSQKSVCLDTDVITGTNLVRNVKFDTSVPNTVTATVSIYWSDSGGIHQINSVTIFSNWENK